MITKSERRRVSKAADCLLALAIRDAENLNRRKMAGEDVAAEAVDLLPILAIVGRMQDIAEGGA
ncbi:hypothetical protein [Pedococcus bigeumensis]|uniref:Uncharacterized protein n=1 Tax=Pedococcus bigeumensis TaxID=433644 RepID=A0A502CLA1_9MICO|nr:hypothetical protein [Pedococcus bigeumensis]TPG12556.1 hypothetical protein EAH86_19825 [Pedococcus bigeumensis]